MAQSEWHKSREERQVRTCPCGVEVIAARWQVRTGKAKYCSKACKYKFRIRPSGLTYKLKVVNSTWFHKGERANPSHEFKKGQRPHNWKGDAVGYDALHDWVKRHRGKAVLCEWCGSDYRPQWANKSFQYKRDLSDWIALCYTCHRKYDRVGEWGAASRKFPEMKAKRQRRKDRMKEAAA